MLEADNLLATKDEASTRKPLSVCYGFGGFILSLCVVVGISGLFLDVNSSGQGMEMRLGSHYNHGPPDASMCKSDTFTKTTLKADYDMTFASLIKETRGQSKWEASDVVIIDDKFYAVCDNSWSIQVIGDHFTPLSNSNYQIGPPKGDSDFESIIFDNVTKVFYLIRESQPIPTENDEGDDIEYHAIIHGVKLSTSGDSYTDESVCVSEQTFDDHTKGFEGAISMRDAGGEVYILGLCEGNKCRVGREGETPGNGRIVIMSKTKISDPSKIYNGQYDCEWSTVRTIDIPKSAKFEDYSAIAYNPNTGKVAITSQQFSQIWIGNLTMPGQGGTFDSMSSELIEDGSVVLNFPRDDDCNIIYCNVEGIHWLSDSMLVGVSDKMKSGGRQDYRCKSKDQSIHLFSLP